MPYKDKEKIKVHNKEYFSRPEVKEKAKEYYSIPERKEYMKEYYARPDSWNCSRCDYVAICDEKDTGDQR